MAVSRLCNLATGVEVCGQQTAPLRGKRRVVSFASGLMSHQCLIRDFVILADLLFWRNILAGNERGLGPIVDTKFLQNGANMHAHCCVIYI
jgi:hypothetical protein